MVIGHSSGPAPKEAPVMITEKGKLFFWFLTMLRKGMIVGLMCTIECNHTSKARQIHVAQESTITNRMAMVNATVALVQINKVQRKILNTLFHGRGWHHLVEA